MNALIGPQDDRNPYLNLRRISQERSFAKAADYAGKNVLVLGIGGLGNQFSCRSCPLEDVFLLQDQCVPRFSDAWGRM